MSDLKDRAATFARELTETVHYVVGPDCPEFVASALLEESVFIVRQSPEKGIVLSTEEGPLLRLEVEYYCTWDGYRQYLAVEKSAIRVFVAQDGRDPLFRYEFDTKTRDTLPAAHIHFHGIHPELEAVMSESGTSAARSKKRNKSKDLLSSLHFPVGGTRFRPALEDVMQMLIREFGIRPHGGLSTKAAYKHLAEARERWRRVQVATCVRDAPAAAVETLRALGYEVVEPPNHAQLERPEKLRSV